jgi:hypothetical protein
VNRTAAALLLGVLVSTAACSSFLQVSSVDAVQADEKVVIGDLQIVDGDLSEWTTGILASVNLAFAYDLPVHDGQFGVGLNDGDDVLGAGDERPFGVKGGVFHVGIKNQPTYLLSIRVNTTLILANVRTIFPLLIKIAPSANKCEYVGTILVKRLPDKTLHVEIVDTFDRFKATYAGYVAGCDLRRAIAVKVSPEDIKATLRRNNNP